MEDRGLHPMRAPVSCPRRDIDRHWSIWYNATILFALHPYLQK